MPSGARDLQVRSEQRHHGAAPRAASASATPMRPDERLPRNRTASSGSRVPPAVTSTCFPASEPPPVGLRREGAARHARRSPPARPCAPGRQAPRRARRRPGRRARRRARRGARGSPGSPGAPTSPCSSRARARSGPRCASAVSVSRSSASPCASRAMVCAVSGATTSRSAPARCGYGSLGGSLRASAQNVSRGDEPLGPARRDRRHVVPGVYEQAQELARLVGGDATRYAEEDARHGHIVPAR